MIEEKLPTFALDAVRRSLPLDSWDRYADLIVADRRNRLKSLEKPEPDRRWFHLLDPLRQNGFVKLPTTLPKYAVDEVMSYMSTHQVHKGPHVFAFNGIGKPPERTKPLDVARGDFSMAG